MNKYFKLFAHNIPVEGKERSAIYNLQQHDLLLVPNIMYDIISLLQEKDLKSAQEMIAPNDPACFQKYIDFLLQKDLGFLTETPETFPALSLSWDQPNHIINAIVCRDQSSSYDLGSLFDQLDGLLCKHLELRLLNPSLNAQQLCACLEMIKGKSFRTTSLFLNGAEQLTEAELANIYRSFSKLDQIIVFNSYPRSLEEFDGKVLFAAASMEAALEEARLKDKPFVNIDYFMEAQQFNPFYNRKVCVDEEGNIKNDLILKTTHGNINTDALADVIQRPSFQSLWHAAPDRIEEIKDSPLRYATSLAFALEQTDSGSYRKLEYQQETQTSENLMTC